jgi:hypothetical protein
LSDSQGIEQTFQHAIRYQANTANTLVVVLLDEVGLAEQSLNLPLKVLLFFLLSILFSLSLC